MKSFFAPLASLRLTVVLFSLSIVLVFFGTLALINESMWTVINSYFRSLVTWIKFDLIRQFLTVFFFYPKTSPSWGGSFPFPGGIAIAIALLANMIAAHAVRFKFAWRRVGIITLHAGLIVLLGGELITRFFAVEATMTIQEGETANYVDVSDASELAFIDPTDSSVDRVVSISHQALKRAAANKSKITYAALPFDVKVDQFHKNTSIKGLKPGMTPRTGSAVVTDTSGVPWEIWGVDESAGTDQDMRENATAARVTLLKKGTDETVAVLFVSNWLDRNFTRRQIEFPPQTASDGTTNYRVEMRPKRIYKPYTIALKKFEHDVFPGTDKAKDFASTIRLIHPERSENREVRIWMNNPLRYDSSKSTGVWGALRSLNPVWNDSETFFQAGYIPDDSGTILQVVRNPSWLWPYISCVMITVGMLIHFLLVLTKYFARQWKAASATAVAATIPDVVPVRRGLPIAIAFVIALIFVGYLGSKARMPKVSEGALDTVAFGRIPVQEGGRIQPLDSFARNTLQAISNSELFDVPRTEEEIAGISAFEKIINTIRSSSGATKSRPAIEWLLSNLGTRDLFDSPGAQYRVFRIESIEVLDFLGLERRPGYYRYSPAELKPKYPKLIEEYEKASDVDSKKRTLFQAKIFELGNKLAMYQRIVMLRTPATIPPQAEGEKWSSVGDFDLAVSRPRVDAELQAVVLKLKDELESKGKTFDQIPPETQREIMQFLEEKKATRTKDIADEFRPKQFPAGQAFVDVLKTGRAGDAAAFNSAMASFTQQYGSHVPELAQSRTRTEVWLNAFDPFYWCSVLFVVAFALGLGTWLSWNLPRVRLAFWLSAILLLVVTLVVQITAMIARMYLMDRPFVFVTNLYSSAVFIGTCIAVLCLILESFTRLGVGTVVAASLGFASTYIARHLQATGDTLEMMQAVLDTNFWLATHVTTVTFGYAATFVAGGIALLYCGLGMFTTILRGPANKAVSGMLYGTICFATLLSFVGTVLGGIWADQSWGRFWGWDPKENGALLIVAWNALILHARWAGLVKARGVAVLAIAGIAVTMWSWFGTNQLGIGLHAYGFNNTLALWCTYVWIVSSILMTIAASVPTSLWRSFRTD